MKLQDAYDLVNNLDIKESIRRFGPSWSYIFVNEKLEVEAVERFKKDLSDIEEKAVADKYKGCVYIIGRPGDYASVKEFEKSVKSCQEAFDHIKNNP